MIEISEKSFRRFEAMHHAQGRINRKAVRDALGESYESYMLEAFEQWSGRRPAALYTYSCPDRTVEELNQIVSPFYRLPALRDWLRYLCIRAVIAQPSFFPELLYASRGLAKTQMPGRIYADYDQFVTGLFRGCLEGRGRYVATVALRHFYGWQLRNPRHRITQDLNHVIETILFALMMADD